MGRNLARTSGPAIFVVVPTAEHLKSASRRRSPTPRSRSTTDRREGEHFRAEVVSGRFEGLSRIQQHKLVYDVFGSEVGGAIHALSIKTSTPEG